MAANPFDQFDAKPANPFDQFDAPAKTSASTSTSPAPAPTPAGQDLGTTALWNKPADTSWSDYLLAHLAKPFQGADQAAQDYSRTAVDAATFGLGDRFQSYLTGNPLAQERAQTAAASSRLGAMAPIVQGAMYAAGPGEIGAASKIGEAVAPAIGKWAGGVLGSGVEGAIAGGAGAAGHDESIGQGALLGGALGAAGGVPGGVVGRGGTLAPAVSEGALRANAKTAYAPLDEYCVFHGPSQIKPALDSVTNTMTQAEQDLAKQTMAKVNKLADTNLATGSDIQSYQKIFGDLSTSPVKADREYAPQFKKALETVMQGDAYGRNTTPGQGMSLMLPGSLGNTGLTTGGAAAARDAGNIPFGRANDVARLDDPNSGWIAQSQVKRGPDVGNQVSSWLRTPEGQQYAPRPAPGAPPNAYTAYNTVAGTGANPESVPWWVKHFVIAPTIGVAAKEGIDAATGQDHPSPMARIGEDLAVGGGLALGTMGYGALTERVNRLAQQRAIDALRSTISTGNYQAPIQPATPLRDFVRQLIYGQGTAGKLPGQ